MVGVAGFEARFTGGGAARFEGICRTWLDCPCWGAESLGCSENMPLLGCTGRELGKFRGEEVAERDIVAVGCFGMVSEAELAKIGFGGDTGDWTVTVGGVGGDQGPVEAGRCLDAAPGASFLGVTLEGPMGSSEKFVVEAVSPGVFHGEGRLGRSRDDLALSCSKRGPIGGFEMAGCEGGGLELAMFSKWDNRDDTGFCRDISSLAQRGSSMILVAYY